MLVCVCVQVCEHAANDSIGGGGGGTGEADDPLVAFAQ